MEQFAPPAIKLVERSKFHPALSLIPVGGQGVTLDINNTLAATVHAPSPTDLYVLRYNASTSQSQWSSIPSLGGVTAYARDTNTNDVVSSAAETSFASFVVSANDMSTNRMLRLTVMGDYLHNVSAADSLTVRVKFGGTTFFAGIGSFGNSISATRHPWIMELRVANLGATNSQMIAGQLRTELTAQAAPSTGIGGALAAEGATTTLADMFGISTLGSIDTTANRTLDVTASWSQSSANNSWRKRYALLELV